MSESKEDLLARFMRHIHSIPEHLRENEGHRLLAVALQLMTREQITGFRAEIAATENPQNVLNLIDGHLALRDITSDCGNHSSCP